MYNKRERNGPAGLRCSPFLSFATPSIQYKGIVLLPWCSEYITTVWIIFRRAAECPLYWRQGALVGPFNVTCHLHSDIKPAFIRFFELKVDSGKLLVQEWNGFGLFALGVHLQGRRIELIHLLARCYGKFTSAGYKVYGSSWHLPVYLFTHKALKERI